MWFECGVLGNILFICVGFIRVWVSRVVRGVGSEGVEMGCFVMVL